MVDTPAWDQKQQYSTKELYNLAVGAGFKGDAARTMAAVATAESGGNPRAINWGDPGGSFGVDQINAGAHGQGAKRALDPTNGMKQAYALFQKRGNFDDWSTYKSGEYRKYMMPPQKEAAARPKWDVPQTNKPIEADPKKIDAAPAGPQWRLPAKNEGPREKVKIEDVPNDPSIAARQKQPKPDPEMVKSIADQAGLTAWAKKQYKSGILSPDALSNALGSITEWSEQKAHDALAKIGVPESLIRDAIQYATEFYPMQKGLGVGGFKPPTEAPRGGEAGTGVPNLPGAPKAADVGPKAVEAELAKPEAPSVTETPQLPTPKQNFKPAGAASVPVHEILAENIKQREETLAKTQPRFNDHMNDAANLLKSFTAPETMVDKGGARTAESAAASIRKFSGRATQANEQAKAAFDQYIKTMDSLTPEEGLQVIDWLQKPEKVGLGGYEPTPQVAKFMGQFKDLMQVIQTKLEALPKTENMAFKENYVSQMWKDPKAVLGYIQSKAPRAGSNYFTKKSVFDSYEEGIRAGFVPVTTNALEIAMRYAENANRWIAKQEVVQEGKALGNIVYRAPGKEPKGWVKLKNAGAVPGVNEAYAPEGYATIYNNWLSAPLGGNMGRILTGLQRASNIATATKLGLSAYHAGLMYNESMASAFAQAITRLTHGHVLSAMLKTAEAPIYPIMSVARARKVMKGYLTGERGADRVIDSMVDANFRVVGKGNIADEYRVSFLPTLFDSWKKGRLRMETAEAMRDIKQHPLSGPPRQALNVALRALETSVAPMFQYVVPRLKVGAGYDMIQQFLKEHPDATESDLTTYARKVSNIVDDRFGEMNHDNIFWDRTQKQVLQTMLMSYSYTWGSMRAMGSAAYDALHVGSRGWTEQMSYPIGLAAAVALEGMIYQYLKTGKLPAGQQDLTAPQTGGTDQQTGKPARAKWPSQLFSIVNALRDPAGEFGNKVNVLWKTLWEASITNKDWRDDPIVNKNDPVVQQIIEWAKYVGESFVPIFLDQQRKPGYNISEPERFFGAREAPMRDVDPERSQRGQEWAVAEQNVRKRLHDEGKSVPHKVLVKMIQAEIERTRQARGYKGPE